MYIFFQTLVRPKAAWLGVPALPADAAQTLHTGVHGEGWGEVAPAQENSGCMDRPSRSCCSTSPAGLTLGSLARWGKARGSAVASQGETAPTPQSSVSTVGACL